MPPAKGPRGGRIALLGSPRGLTNGGERPAVRGLHRGLATDLNPRLLWPVVGGVLLAMLLFAAWGPVAQGTMGPNARAAVAVAGAAVALGLLFLVFWSRE